MTKKDIFTTRLKALLSKGVLPLDRSSRPAGTTINFQGYPGWVVAVAAVCGALALAAIGSLYIYLGDERLIPRAREAKIAQIEDSGINLARYSAADLRARFAFSSADGKILIALGRILSKPMADAFVNWLGGMPAGERQTAVEQLMALISDVGASSNKRMLLMSLARIDDAAAGRLLAAGGVDRVLENLSLLPPESQRLIADAGFPIVPQDKARAEIIAAVNSGTFPIQEFQTIQTLRRASPERVGLVDKFLSEKSPVHICKSVPATPSACFLSNYACPAGAYPTIASVQCVFPPPGVILAK